MISLYAKEAVDNEITIIAATDTQKVHFKVVGDGSGVYGGNINNNDIYTINTSFKIISPNQPSYILILPLTIRMLRVGNNDFTTCFIDGSIYVYSAEKKKKRNRKISELFFVEK